LPIKPCHEGGGGVVSGFVSAGQQFNSSPHRRQDAGGKLLNAMKTEAAGNVLAIATKVATSPNPAWCGRSHVVILLTGESLLIASWDDRGLASHRL
jgi:hypothetical protein